LNARAIKSVRCAIYTRVSTDQGLEQDFNSLDAQYDATGTAGYGPATALPLRPICTLRHAGVSGGIREPFGGRIGDVDRLILAMGCAPMASKQRSAGTRAPLREQPLIARASTPNRGMELKNGALSDEDCRKAGHYTSEKRNA
jgi:hypothetical protein